MEPVNNNLVENYIVCKYLEAEGNRIVLTKIEEFNNIRDARSMVQRLINHETRIVILTELTSLQDSRAK